MTAPRRRSAYAAGAFALALTLTSCTGSPDPTPAPTTSESSTADQSTDVGPVEQLQIDIVGAVDDEAWARVEHDRFEESVAQCMRAAGFEYTPEEDQSDTEDEDTESIEYAREYGYGISTYDDELDGEFEDDEPTPNDEYVSELDDDELDAYWVALEGEIDEDDEGGIDLSDLEDEDGEIDLGDLEMGEDGELDLGDLDDEAFEEDLGDEGDIDLGDLDDLGYGGCQGEAYEALLADPLPYDFPEHQDVLMALDELYADIASDESLVATEEAWATCMEEAGYPDLVTSDDAQYLVFDAYEEAWAEVPEDADDISEELLAPIRDLELAVAVADVECREKSGLSTAYRDLQNAAERDFVEANRDALVAYFEDMGAVLEG